MKSSKHDKLRNNSTVVKELPPSIVDLTVANTVLLATCSANSKTDICDRQIKIDDGNSSTYKKK